MTSITLEIDILSHWCAGSGRGRGADVDALVIKDGNGLPYLPGRTVKGLLREGMMCCEENGQVPPGTTDCLFGKPTVPGKPDGSVPGVLSFRDARLPVDVVRYLFGKPDLVDAMYDVFSSTKLDDNGMAEDKTLRTIELAIPMKLETVVEVNPVYANELPRDLDWKASIQKACSMVRALGSHRHRGLGRCVFAVRQ